MGIAPAKIVLDGYNTRSIINAIERIILLYRNAVPNVYDANVKGIVEALIDLGNVLEGVVPPPQPPIISTMGPYPPGWDVGTQSYDTPPVDGSFWFDTRQGRLFIADDSQWWQTNGVDAPVHVGRDAPSLVFPGRQWFDCRQGRLLVWIDDVTASGAPGWYQTNGAGGPVPLP
jgi:hypothetical protein